jgi:hypothetical protein
MASLKATLTVVSAIVAFGTYIVRDEVRDRFKDTVSAVDAASTNFGITRNLFLIGHKVQYSIDTDEELSDLLSTFSLIDRRHKGIEGDYVTTLGFDEETAYKYSDILASIHLEDGIIPMLPEREEFKRRQDDLIHDIQTTSSAFSRFETTRPSNKNISIDEQRAALIDYSHREAPFDTATVAFGVAITDLDKSILDASRVLKQDAERQYSYVNWASLVLFALASILALVAQLAGDDIESRHKKRKAGRSQAHRAERKISPTT